MKRIKRYIFILTIIIILIIIIIILLVKIKLTEENCNYLGEEQSIVKEITLEEENKKCTVDIKGAVKKPGVYTAECNTYVNDIINISGGLNENADTSTINLAKQIKDEMVIIIYTKEEIATKKLNNVVENECHCPDIKNDICINNEPSNNALTNINTASYEELKNIPGIGEAKAKAIIEYRNSVGLFQDISDIKNVSGIGENLYEQIKVYITT